MLRIKSLEKRFELFLFVPVTLLLVAMGAAGFIYARRIMLLQWEESAILRLQRSAHLVDMRLSRPKELVRLYLESDSGHMGQSVRNAVFNQLVKTPGVIRVERTPGGVERSPEWPPAHARGAGGRQMMHGGSAATGPHRMNEGNLKITLPRYDADVANETVSLIARIVDDAQEIEAIEVVIDFKFIISDLPRSGWWNYRISFLVDEEGRILVGSDDSKRQQLGDTGNSLEQSTLEALKTQTSGTIRGEGFPPEEISGFYHLMEAPWTIVVFAPGREILEPIIRFRNIYGAALVLTMLTVLVLIRRAVSRTTRSVRTLSSAADRIARGRFGEPLEVSSQDEIGELIRSFNTMSRQLRERIQMKRSLDLAKEVQQNLIPSADPKIDGLDIAGRSEFCDETGGDYYDYIDDNDAPDRRIRFVVGDVAGHGVSSALLMSGVRAGFRQRHSMSGTIEEVVGDLNRQVALDVGSSGRFMTLFCLEIDVERRCAKWVRAGHEPGLLYRMKDDHFEPLMGKGIPLGVEKETTYSAQFVDDLEPGDMFILGTDGLWETTDPSYEMFGKRRFKELIRAHRDKTAASLLAVVFNEIHAFARGEAIQDDITLVIAKIA
jgi:sigma-B regulation protein RsbU (phosphoserine phosphatase)